MKDNIRFSVKFNVFALVLGSLIILAVHSNISGQTPASPQAQSPQSSQQTNSTAVAPTITSGAQDDRVRRAQGYAKLLEGQRYLSGVREEGTTAAVALRSAQQAFEQAIVLYPKLTEAYTALAETHLYLGNAEEAERRAGEAVKLDANNFGSHRILSRIYTERAGLRENQIDASFASKAISELREAARLKPEDAEAWALLGELYEATGKTDEAINAFSQWLAAPAPLDSRFYRYITGGRELSPAAAAARLGQALLRAGRTKEAITALRRAVQLDSSNREYAEALGQAIAQSDDPAEALGELEKIAAGDPSNVNSQLLLARAKARAGRTDEAISDLKKSIARFPNEEDTVELRLELAQLLSDALRYDEAITAYKDALRVGGIGSQPIATTEQRTFAVQIYGRIIDLQRQAGRDQDARASIERLRSLIGNDNPLVDYQLVTYLRDSRKLTEALEVVRGARRRFPQISEFLRLEAYVLTDLGKVDEAATLLRTQLSNGTQDYNTYVTLASLYTQAGRGREAVESARKALELAGQQPGLQTQAQLVLASAQERAGDPKGAEDSLRQVLRREPANSTALNNLGYYLTERGEKLNEALEMILRAHRAEPTNSSFLDSLGWVYFKLNRVVEAEKYLTEAVRRDSTSATVQEHLGDLYQKLGKSEQARAAWQRALTLSTEAEETARIKAKLK